MISPENQRYAIEQFAARENITIIDWVEGIDQSGSRKRSEWWTRLDSIIERVEAGEADAIVGWKFSRTARNRVKWAVALDRVESAGGQILSATEVNDPSPPGRLARGMLAEFAAFEAENIGATWKETLERRVRHGLVYNHKARFGYTRETDHPSGYAPDPVTGAILYELYRRYTAGESARSLAADLTARRIPTTRRVAPGNPIEPYYVTNNLDSGFGAGLIKFRGEYLPGAHEPIISPNEWDAYVAARAPRRRAPRAESTRGLLSGSSILYCWCGSPMYSNSAASHGRLNRIYKCHAVVKTRAHAGGNISGKVLEEHVVAWLHSKRDKLEAAAKRIPKRPVPVVDRARALQARIDELTEQLDVAGMRLIKETIPHASYERLRDRLTTEVAALELERQRVESRPADPVPMLIGILDGWERFDIGKRRAALKHFIDRITINPVDSEERIEIESHLND